MNKFFTLVAVAALFVACGTDKKTEEKPTNNSAGSVVKSGELKIGYFDTDSIPNHFDFYKSETAKLEAEGLKLEQKASQMQSTYQSVANDYQRGLQNNTLSDNQKISFENKLQGLQQQMAAFQQNEMGAFQQKQYESNEVLMNKIAQYSAEYAKENGYSMFFVRGQGSGVAYADPSMDQTTPFIAFMNEKEKALNGVSAK